MKASIFKKELDLIQDEELRNATYYYFERVVPSYFWHIPASSTGKYHPEQDLGEGGLVRHSRMVAVVAAELLNQTMWVSLLPYKDDIIVACLIHDTFKNGNGEQYTIFNHPNWASHAFYETINSLTDASESLKKHCQIICQCVETHMGQWNTSEYEPEIVLRTPERPYEKFVHLCDFISSKKFIGNLDKY